MNKIDNGIQKVLNIKRVDTEYELYFQVTFIDWYGGEQIRRFQNIKNLKYKQWFE